MSKIYGIRYDDKQYAVGSELPKSHVWEDGVMTKELLKGTSAIYAEYDPVYDDEEPDWMKLAQKNNIYGYEHAYVIASEGNVENGEDAGEVILPDAHVERIIW